MDVIARKYFKVLYEDGNDEFGPGVVTLEIKVPKGYEDDVSLKEIFQQIHKDWEAGELLDQ